MIYPLPDSNETVARAGPLDRRLRVRWDALTIEGATDAEVREAIEERGL